MKKFIALLLSAVICLPLVACQNSENNNDYEKYDKLISMIEKNDYEKALAQLNKFFEEENEEENKGNLPETEEIQSLIIDLFGTSVINEDLIEECIDEVVELTTENWREYISVITLSQEFVRTDAFGEITETGTVDRIGFGIESNRYYSYEDVVIELKYLPTGEIETHRVSAGLVDVFPLYRSTNLDDYECTRIKGKVYFLTFPEEAISWETTTDFRGCISTIGTVNIGGEYFFSWYTIDQQTNACDTSNYPISELLN